MTALWAASLHRGLVHVLPGSRPSKHIIHLLPLEMHLLLERLINDEHVRACFTEESKIRSCFLGQEQVRASWAEQHLLN